MQKNMMPAVIIRNEHHKDTARAKLEEVTPSQKKPTCVFIGPWEETRSDKQNRYLWGWVYANIADMLNSSGQVISATNDAGQPRDIAWTKDLLHVAFELFRKLPPVKTLKGEIQMTESTSTMTKKRFSQYLKDIDQACHSWWGISIPLPVGVWVQYWDDIKP